ncbi:MAG TPA: efflux RND transporter periplasmic adaptor subunit [Anaerolineales bacterium]|nr:efflux RND transporter periplasmic adaptor subunit [Anaerolineales bacterium]
MNKRITYSGLFLALALLLAACGTNANTNAIVTPSSADTVVAEGHLAPSRNQYLAFTARGKVDQILVKKGDKVRQGQVLVSLADRQQAQAALTAAQLGLTSAQQAFDALNRTGDLGRAQAWQAYMDAQKVRESAQLAWDALDQSTIQTNIDNAQSDVTSRKTDLDNAQTDFNKYADLANDNPTRKSYEQALRTAQTNYDQAVQKVETLTNDRDRVQAALLAAQNAEAEAKRTYENSQNGPDRDKLALAQAQLDNAKAQVASAQDALDNYDLKAPFDCTVMDINISENQMIGPETWAVAVADTSQWYVDTSDLNELDVVKVSVGQKVDITADALPGVNMTGVVESIGLTPINQGTDVLYTVHIRLDNPDPRLRWGMTMEVTFPTNK